MIDASKKNVKYIKDVTIEEALLAAKQKDECGLCTKCICNGHYWKDNLDSTCDGYFVRIAEEIFSRLETTPEEPQKEEPRTLTPDMLPYSQTINMMKKKGYKHCYMCGSDLGGK